MDPIEDQARIQISGNGKHEILEEIQELQRDIPKQRYLAAGRAGAGHS